MTHILYTHLLGGFCLNYDGAPLTTANTSRLQLLLDFLVLPFYAPTACKSLASLRCPHSPQLRQARPDTGHFLKTTNQAIRWWQNTPFTLGVTNFEQLPMLSEVQTTADLPPSHQPAKPNSAGSTHRG